MYLSVLSCGRLGTIFTTIFKLVANRREPHHALWRAYEMRKQIDELLELPWKKVFISVVRRYRMDALAKSGEYVFSQKHHAFC